LKAFGELGFNRLARFVWTSFLLAIFRIIPFPPFRSAFLRMCGARIGSNTVLHRFTLINVDRGGFKALRIGTSCFVGPEVLIDLAGPVLLEDHVTLAPRSVLLTHFNVGYTDHPLMTRFPPKTAGVTILRGCFIGAAAVVLAGCKIGPNAVVAAAALVNRDVAPGERVGGVPIRSLNQ
jgi:acetyltransferase-like isoleucine patch superfamily enzyme